MIDEKLPLDAARGPLPLTDADFDAIRAGVMAKIGREKRSWPGFVPLRLTFATAAIAIVAISMFLILRRTDVPPAVARTSVAPAPDAAAAPRVIAPPLVAAAPETAAAEPRQPAPLARKHPIPRHRPEPAAAVDQQVAVASQATVTIQLQTSNPDVRIIWITR